jgi:hypothetical protein
MGESNCTKRVADMNLHNWLTKFDAWASTQPRDCDGWESWFPEWSALLAATIEAMRGGQSDPESLKDIARVWSISEETEDLSDIVERCPGAFAEILPQLLDVGDWRCRFQIYALGACGAISKDILLKGLSDDDSYVVRRSLLALAEIDKEAARVAARTFTSSSDDMLRKVASDLLTTEP